MSWVSGTMTADLLLGLGDSSEEEGKGASGGEGQGGAPLAKAARMEEAVEEKKEEAEPEEVAEPEVKKEDEPEVKKKVDGSSCQALVAKWWPEAKAIGEVKKEAEPEVKKKVDGSSACSWEELKMRARKEIAESVRPSQAQLGEEQAQLDEEAAKSLRSSMEERRLSQKQADEEAFQWAVGRAKADVEKFCPQEVKMEMKDLIVLSKKEEAEPEVKKEEAEPEVQELEEVWERVQELVMQSGGLVYVGGTKSPAVRWLGDRSRAMVGHRRERGGKMEVLAVGVQGTGPRPAQ
jgi:hypothetical protein